MSHTWTEPESVRGWSVCRQAHRRVEGGGGGMKEAGRTRHGLDICIIDPCRIRAPTDFIYEADTVPSCPSLAAIPGTRLPSCSPLPFLVGVRATYALCSSFCTFRQFTFIAWRMRCLRAAQDVPPGSAMSCIHTPLSPLWRPSHEIYTHCGLGTPSV